MYWNSKMITDIAGIIIFLHTQYIKHFLYSPEFVILKHVILIKYEMKRHSKSLMHGFVQNNSIFWQFRVKCVCACVRKAMALIPGKKLAKHYKNWFNRFSRTCNRNLGYCKNGVMVSSCYKHCCDIFKLLVFCFCIKMSKFENMINAKQCCLYIYIY